MSCEKRILTWGHLRFKRNGFYKRLALLLIQVVASPLVVPIIALRSRLAPARQPRPQS